MRNLKVSLPIPVTVIFGLLAVSLSLFVSLIFTSPTHAANAHDFNPGNIIDDYTFTNNGSMSAQQIQDFFNQKNSVCLKNYRGLALIDANGDGFVSDLTNAEQYGGPSGNATMSAAELIKAASDIYKINPQVLIVTLQKEQGLITRSDCPDWRFNTAFGFGCPDTAPCDQTKYGFTRQLDNAAYHFKGYFNNSLRYVPYQPGVRTINWNPQGWCGSSQVNIENRATASLYSYTPYRPNQAAINAGYGTGDDCSSYGNRNFFLYFTDWFGSTQSKELILQNVFVDQSLSITPTTSNTGNQVYTASFTLRNITSSTINLGFMFVSVRDADNNNYDFPVRNITLAPNSTYTYTASRTFPLVGKLHAYIGGNLNLIGWTYDAPYSLNQNIRREADFYSGTEIANAINTSARLDSSLEISPTSSLDPNQVYTAKFTVKNTSNQRIDLGFMFVSVRDANNNNYDFPSRDIVLEPNASYTYTASRTFPQVGKLRTFIGGKFTQLGWSYDTPAASSNSIVRERSIIPKSDVVLSGEGISVTKVSGNQYRATATLKNTSGTVRNVGWFLVSGRNPLGENIDFPTQNIIIPPNSSVTYSQTRNLDLTDLGRFTFFTNLDDPLDGYGWTTTYPASDSVNAKRETFFVNGPNVQQTQPLSTRALSDGTIEATVQYTNFGDQREYMGWVIPSTRLTGSSTNYDFPPQEITLNPGEVRNLTFKQRFVKGGSYSTNLIYHRTNPVWWSDSYAPPQTDSVDNSLQFTSTFAAEQVGDITLSRSGSTATATITLRNTTNQFLELGSLIISVRDSQNNNLDFPITWATLNPNETRTFNFTRQLSTGTYRVTATNNHYLHGWGPTFKLNTDKNYSL